MKQFKIAVVLFPLIMCIFAPSFSFSTTYDHPKDLPKLSITFPDDWNVTYDEDENLVAESQDKNMAVLVAEIKEIKPTPVRNLSLLISNSIGYWKSSGSLIEGQINIFSANPDDLYSDLFAITAFVNPTVFKDSYEDTYLKIFRSISAYESSSGLTNPILDKQGEDKSEFIDFLKLREEYKSNKDSMTKLGFKTWWEKTQNSLKGKIVTSKGYVDEGKETWTGKLIIRLDIDEPSIGGSAYDIELMMEPEKDKELVAGLKKDEEITFTGKIELFDIVLGSLLVKLENVTVHTD